MKVIVIGCTHAGTAAVNQILASNPDTEVTIYERNDNVSFLSSHFTLAAKLLILKAYFIPVLNS